METKLLLKPSDFKPTLSDWKIDGSLNPGAVRMPNGKILLMVRIAESCTRKKEGHLCPRIVLKKEYDRKRNKDNKGIIIDTHNNKTYFVFSECILPNISHFRKVVLDDSGMKVEKISRKPDFLGLAVTSEYGVEDARIVNLEGKYAMTYVSVSDDTGVSSSLAVSDDLINWDRKGIIFQEQNKDVVLFPEKIRGRYVALNRPETMFPFSHPAIWISYSDDLVYWGKETKILLTRKKNSWDSNRLGAGCPPIKTEKGWLIIYHGVFVKGKGNVYNAGAALLDLKNPAKVLARSPADKPLFAPKNDFEKFGFMNEVVFPSGIVEDFNGRDVLVYSGGADSVVSVRKISYREIFRNMGY